MKKILILLFFPIIFSCGTKENANDNGRALQNAPANNTPVTAQPESTVTHPVSQDTLHKKDTLRKP